MNHKPTRQIKPNRVGDNCPSAWFATLEMARDRNDAGMADRAKAELLRLGVVVQFFPVCEIGPTK